MSKKTLIAYTHAPISPGIKGLHIMLFKVLEAFKDNFDIYLLSRTEECYRYYREEFSDKFQYVNLIDVPKNMTEDEYQFGMVEKLIKKAVQKIDYAFWFFPGLASVTPESRIAEAYQKLSSGEWTDQKIKIDGKVDGSVVQQAEMLYAVTQFKPKFLYRVGDYTEPHIEKAIPYPMQLLSFHDYPALGHKKFHDTEWFQFSDPKEDREKIYDFVFGYTVEIPERAYLSDFCFDNIIQNDRVKLYIKDKHFSRHSPIDTQLPSDVYYDKIAQAKFSLIAPSTDPTEVSLIRIYEDICRKCVPIFMNSVQYWKVFDDEASELIRDNLVYVPERDGLLNDFIKKLDYDSLIKKILSLKMIRECYDREKLKQLMLKEIGEQE